MAGFHGPVPHTPNRPILAPEDPPSLRKRPFARGEGGGTDSGPTEDVARLAGRAAEELEKVADASKDSGLSSPMKRPRGGAPEHKSSERPPDGAAVAAQGPEKQKKISHRLQMKMYASQVNGVAMGTDYRFKPPACLMRKGEESWDVMRSEFFRRVNEEDLLPFYLYEDKTVENLGPLVKRPGDKNFYLIGNEWDKPIVADGREYDFYFFACCESYVRAVDEAWKRMKAFIKEKGGKRSSPDWLGVYVEGRVSDYTFGFKQRNDESRYAEKFSSLFLSKGK